MTVHEIRILNYRIPFPNHIFQHIRGLTFYQFRQLPYLMYSPLLVCVGKDDSKTQNYIFACYFVCG